MASLQVPRSYRLFRSLALAAAAISGATLGGPLLAQTVGSALPATAPTRLPPSTSVAPLSASAPTGERPHHRAQVSCSNGMLSVRADNSSLNGILRSIAQCTGMKITGGVIDQRVYGSYGPAAPATVLATLIDGTETNMLLQETASDQPAELILTPRMGGASPPGPAAVPEDALEENTSGAPNQPATGQPTQPPGSGQPMSGMPGSRPTTSGYSGEANQTPVPQPSNGSAVTGPVSIPQPGNNVNGSPNNVSPSASTYPTTNSVSSDTLPTPSTTPSTDGIVDAPNPPAAGSDTDRLLHGGVTNNPGNTNFNPNPTGSSTQPGGTNTATPVPTGAIQPGADSTGTSTPSSSGTGTGALTPEQVYDRLQQMNGSRTTAPAAQTAQPQVTQPQVPQPATTAQPQ